MILPFSGMHFAEAETSQRSEIPKDIEPKEVKITMTKERQAIIDKVAALGESLQSSKTTSDTENLRSELDALKPEMIKHGLTPTFEFNENIEDWKEQIRDNAVTSASLESDQTVAAASSADWNVKHSLKWGCNPIVYCTDIWPEWVDLNDWSSMTWTMPTVHQSYSEIEHHVANFSGSSQSETMKGWESTSGVEPQLKHCLQSHPNN
ncbi:MAG: hypothetical protein ACR2LL_00345 [Nitrosopumilus sp.]